ncbi:MAG: BPTI/Kunitz domain-containing protein [Polyangiaceae bacterium]
MSKQVAGFALFSACVALVAACGGSARIEAGPPPDPGVAGQSTGSAGQSSGSAGQSSGGAGQSSGGAGPTPGDACSAAQVAGQCDGYQPSFWHNPKTGLCEPFIYGGCDGNANRYATRDACLTACGGGGSNWGACRVDSDCAFTSTSCCAACDPIVDWDLLALSDSHWADYSATQPCASVGACAPCLALSELDATGKYFRPVCVAGQCSALDVRQSAYTECTTDNECTLRDGVKCCPECDGGFVAVASQSNFCPNGPQSCPKCAAIAPPPYLQAVCNGQHCELADTLK